MPASRLHFHHYLIRFLFTARVVCLSDTSPDCSFSPCMKRLGIHLVHSGCFVCCSAASFGLYMWGFYIKVNLVIHVQCAVALVVDNVNRCRADAKEMVLCGLILREKVMFVVHSDCWRFLCFRCWSPKFTHPIVAPNPILLLWNTTGCTECLCVFFPCNKNAS